ncbi:MoaD/ThiS family protein [Actinacidiphila yeochonensis]|uniref:MoaD/ThiS family protein n=1 Tax=Actinacidiphila yeochonensis TaxID=89050 RepID=UPI00056C6205|nr:MoaD/ThiS family protein [Actinacidiphila yeochonensis]
MSAADTGTRPAAGTIRYWAAAKAAAGTAEEPYRAATLADALAEARERHTRRPEFARVLRRCSFLVDGEPVGTRDHHAVPLPDGGTVEVLPPFAGG